MPFHGLFQTFDSGQIQRLVPLHQQLIVALEKFDLSRSQLYDSSQAGAQEICERRVGKHQQTLFRLR